MSFFPPGGPSLPTFNSLLVHGTFNPSAPLHLGLSTLREHDSKHATVLILTPSSDRFVQEIQALNDDWLSMNALTGYGAFLLSRIRVLSAPNAAQLALILSEIHVVEDRIVLPPHSSDTVLSSPPVLIILHDLSSYFRSDPESSMPHLPWTISSYLGLVVKALALQKRLSRISEPSLALFDAHLDKLNLPLIANPSRPLSTSDLMSEHNDSIVTYLRRYFQMTAEFSEQHGPGASDLMDEYCDDEEKTYFRSSLTREGDNSSLVESWSWTCKRRRWRTGSEERTVQFHFT